MPSSGAPAADAGNRLFRGAIDAIQAYQHQPIAVLGDQGGICKPQHRWGVKQHQIKLTGLLKFVHQRVHAVGTEQAGAVGRLAAGGEHAPIVVTGRAEQHHARSGRLP